MSEFTPSFPAIKGSCHIPDAQAEAVFASPETEVLGIYPFKAENFHTDSIIDVSDRKISVEGHIEDDRGFHHTTFDIKRAGTLRRCYFRVLNLEPTAKVSIKQQHELNPSLPSWGKIRYSNMAAISSARKASSRKTRQASPL